MPGTVSLCWDGIGRGISHFMSPWKLFIVVFPCLARRQLNMRLGLPVVASSVFVSYPCVIDLFSGLFIYTREQQRRCYSIRGGLVFGRGGGVAAIESESWEATWGFGGGLFAVRLPINCKALYLNTMLMGTYAVTAYCNSRRLLINIKSTSGPSSPKRDIESDIMPRNVH